VIDIPPQPDIRDYGVIGSGTQLNLHAAGKIGLSFDVGAPNIMNPNVELNVKGGTVGHELAANPGSVTNVTGGVVGNQLSAFTGTTVNISGGSVGNDLSALAGSTVCCIEAKDGSDVTISGGTILGNNFNRPILAETGSEVNIASGTIDGGTLFVQAAAVMNVSGGILNSNFQAGLNSQVNLMGTQFLLGGQDIAGLVQSQPFTIADRNMTLSGVLADGSPFSFDLNSTLAFNMDGFHPDARLTVTLVAPMPLPGGYNGSGTVDAADYVVWRNSLDQTGTGLPADGNSAGLVNQADYDLWRAHFGNTAANSSHARLQNSGTVPEPHASLFAAIAGILVVWSRRRPPAKPENNCRPSRQGL
jgi:hypothetical protein